MVKKEKIKCTKCLDTGEYWDEDNQNLVKCDCIPDEIFEEFPDDLTLDEIDEFEDGNGY